MIGINGKDWSDLKGEDVKAFLASPDAEETFFFEFKEDRVDPKKITEEVSALANTFGGYIIFGVTDAHAIEGCAAWNEQRITITIHHTITPTPSFDIKKFVINEKTVYVLTERFRKHRVLFGTDTVVTSTRIPKTGLYTIDKRSMAANGISDFSSESIINLLFDSQFVWLGLPDKTEDADSTCWFVNDV